MKVEDLELCPPPGLWRAPNAGATATQPGLVQETSDISVGAAVTVVQVVPSYCD